MMERIIRRMERQFLAPSLDLVEAVFTEHENAAEGDKITYTDYIGLLMSSVSTIINAIKYILIAFVSISLVVSSIMIGIITYISVLERTKEIGILRSIGASKKDISRVFNAETIIEGLISGLLGVGVTALACIPANVIVYNLFDVPNVALLPPNAAGILVWRRHLDAGMTVTIPLDPGIYIVGNRKITIR